MSVWLTIPSARPPAQVKPLLDLWRRQGYKIALWRDRIPAECDFMMTGQYPGYARAVNALVKEVLQRDPECNWVVAGGDDTQPDMSKTADEIARECSNFFWNHNADYWPGFRDHKGTFGVMQPTGDRFANGSIDRIAGSPWMGRLWCERMYGGNGPLYHEYLHMHVDEELQCVAKQLGVFWQRSDLIHLHRHFMRHSDAINSAAVSAAPPPHLVRWNSREHWDWSQALFDRRKAAGFPGHEPVSRAA